MMFEADVDLLNIDSLFDDFKNDVYFTEKENFSISEGSVVLRTVGRIGNQLFEYASAYSLAKETDSKLYIYIDTSERLTISTFNIPKENIILSNHYNKIFFNQLFSSYDSNRAPNSITYQGKKLEIENVNDNNFFELSRKKNNKILIMNDYFQSPILFDQYKEELLEQFIITDINHDKLLPLTKKLYQKDSVCMHFRKGDTEQLSWYYTSIQYPQKAMELSKELLDHPKFYIFSDEIEKIQGELKELKNIESYDIEFVSKHSALEDLYLMSQCGNNIIARSTFSWWAAYLNQNNGFVIAPNKPLHDTVFDIFPYNEVYVKKALYDRYYPKHWILLEERDQNLFTTNNKYVIDKNVLHGVTADNNLKDLNIYSGSHVPLKICKNEGNFYQNLCFENDKKPTVVSAYYQIKSKFKHNNYYEWANNFLQIPFNLVVYTDKENIEWIRNARGKLPIIMIEKSLEELEAYKLKNEYEYFASVDPETYHTPELYMIWAEKIKFVNDAIKLNYYNSNFFVWCDIGTFRDKSYIHNNFISDQSMMNNKLSIAINSEFTKDELANELTNSHRDVSQANVAFGDKSSWQIYDHLFDLTRNDFIEKNIFGGKDQTIINTVIIRYPQLFNLIYQDPSDDGNRWWYLLKEL